MIRAIDISIYTGEVSPDQAHAWVGEGITHAVIAYDTTPLSDRQRAACVGAGMTWDAYRFLYFDRPVQPQIDNVREALINHPESLPGYLWLDVEEDPPAIDAATWIKAATGAIDAYDIGRPTSKVKAGIYTGKWWSDKYVTDFTRLIPNRGWALWAAQWDNNPDPNTVTMFGGWDKAEGKQYAGSIATMAAHPHMARAFIEKALHPFPFVPPNVDGDGFRDRSTQPPPPQPGAALEARIAALEAWMQRVKA